MKVRTLARAYQDLIDGYYFYEDKNEGIGNYFIDSLFAEIDSLSFKAGVHAIRPDGFYSMPSRRFPYSIYYLIDRDTAIVYAVVDSRRDPNWIKRRLK